MEKLMSKAELSKEMCTFPAMHPSNCGINEARINNDVNVGKGETSSAAVAVTIPIADIADTQVTKWMLNKGQGATMGTYDTLLLAFDMDNRVDEARSLWNM
ncbi:hypothetical protein Gohar_017341, partial [Gossypium harknessii]|nr:hypothetical protein [Gossypium harknessii]